MEAQRLSSDRITALPQTIIKTILCLLPIEEAARTSILARDWRYKWTTIPKLVFSLSTVQPKEMKTYDMASARDKKKWRGKLLYVIYQVLLLRRSPIHEFSLSMHSDYTSTEIDQIILHLSTNHTIKKLTLYLYSSLPLSLFSLHQLTDLNLRCCVINHKPMFNGFSNLTSLSLIWMNIPAEIFLPLLSGCPSLKILYCRLFLADIDSLLLFERLPIIEHLTFNDCFLPLKYLGLASVPQKLPILLYHLKYFCFKSVCCGILMSHEFDFLATLIKCSLNLEKIKLEMRIENYDDLNVCEEYPDHVWMEHLNELEIDNFSNCLPQMKFVMTRSPNLKKVILDICEEDKNHC